MADFGLIFIVAVALTIGAGFTVGKATNNMGLGLAVTFGLMALGLFMIAAKVFKALP